jgi:hypothetical protein
MDLTGFADASLDFFRRNTTAVFTLDFDELSLADLVRFKEVRLLLREAQSLAMGGDQRGALRSCSAAFAVLRRAYRAQRWGTLGSPLDIRAPTFWSNDSSDLASEVADYAGDVESALESLDEAVEALSIGLDVERLARFRRGWPRMNRRRDGTWEEASLTRDLPVGTDQAFVHRSIDFVTESALMLQQRLEP